MGIIDKERKQKELLDKSSSETIKYFEQETRQIHLQKKTVRMENLLPF